MSDEKPCVNDELEDHKTALTDWINKANSLSVPETHKDVVKRFVRDCQTLVTDCESHPNPSMADLCDLTDRRASLEIQFNALEENFE